MSKKNKNKSKGEITPKSPNKLPVVAIGASAGGLDALKKFFTAMSPDPGMAFVLVQHLDPTHESTLADLMSRYTPLKVVQARDGMKVESDYLYIIPPNKDMGLMNRTIQLMEPVEPHGMRLPINFFLKNLAEDQKERSIAIIFSGFGSDGTIGIKSIKAAGGMVMAQDPATADSNSMPASAIQTGLVDFILPPEEMPEKLMNYVESAHKTIKKILTPKEETERALQKIFMLIRNRTSHDFSYYKENTVYRRISRRMNIHQIENIQTYLRYLQENPHEIDILFKELLINVTSFFRDKKSFDSFKNSLKELIKQKLDVDNLRVWVPGCSSGEEVYSIAIIIHELLEESGKNIDVQIFGTDIDIDALTTARSGTYPSTIAEDVSPELLNKYFVKKDNVFTIRTDIREMVVFAPHDVLIDPPFTKLDVLSCRNLLIYLNGEAQQKVISNFNYALNKDGILFLGPSESVGEFVDAFNVVDKKWKIFKCVKSTEFIRRFVEVHPIPRTQLSNFETGIGLKQLNTSKSVNIVNLAEKELLDIYVPPSAIITDFGEILYIHGRLGNYLEPAQGKAKLNIVEMAREGLKFELNSSIQNAISKKSEIVVEGLRVKNNGGHIFINLNVKPLELETTKGLLIVSFEEVSVDKNGKKDKMKLNMVTKGDERIRELESELNLTKERLNVTIEEMKSSNEELRSANEELQSMNEESQSTNEELETSKEELQSINEEMVTVNNELQMKIDELTQAKDDMNNLFNSTEIAIIFLDRDLNIRRYTKEATNLIKMIESDVGRPFSDIATNLKYDNFTDDIQQVMDRVTFKETEIETEDGKWFQTRIMPYKTFKNVIDGVVITFNNITERKEQITDALDALELADSVVQTVREPLLVLDSKMKVVSANRSFYQTFKVTPENTIGKNLYIMGDRQWDITSLRNLLEDILPKKADLKDFVVEDDFPNIGHKKIILNARQIYQKGKGTSMILLAMEDVTP
ncbi:MULTISPECIES: chemotaxis protein CheB [Methanobacterium]|uniref:protein-glutamate O-methyltransferase n=1 Tax=Methanobacterium subterraneum TaxID=59277 RepID=A0A2H4VAD3_9EURY|nr:MULTISPECIES: chemotaxis protein CheB [Methanobacterium]AUB55043.1 chemotaxis protein CheR [Methanobacterium subterraneum]AUB57976.1 chemotaxis protein CheR [Methanobacterium sp. MZ-A1]MBW4256575.1 PAS domain-containing protein [Methanobacterium sp. YSL]NMO09951.1 PAS domain-containing protein [Methanobacterium subterraneum]